MRMLTLLLDLLSCALPGRCPEACCHALTHRQICLKASYYTESMQMQWCFRSSHYKTQKRTAGEILSQRKLSFYLFLSFFSGLGWSIVQVYNELDDRLLKEFPAFLEERGVDADMGAYLLGLVNDKEQREYRSWLDNVQKFLKK